MAREQDIRLAFQHRLKSARESLHLSQKELGIRAGLDPFVASTRINRYELGVHQPDMATVERLASAMAVPTAYLFAGDERLARMILAFEKMSVADKEKLLKALERP